MRKSAGWLAVTFLLGLGVGLRIAHIPPRAQALEKTAEIDSSRRTAIVRAVEAAKPAVVSISATRIEEYVVVDPFEWFFPELRRFRRRIRKESPPWMGSGFIVSPDGYIWTNEHVVHGADKIIVHLPDGREFRAKLVGADEGSDVAVLKVKGKGLPHVKLGNSDEVIVGEWAIAIGNPFGNIIKGEPTVTVGVISATGRDFGVQSGKVYRDMIQTDAAINKGNSGGPLVNALGEVIGVNTFIYTGSRWEIGSVGIGFAIPINKVKRIAKELVRYGRVRPFWTGLSVQDVQDPLLAEALGLSRPEGVLITEVEPGSPGQKAGLRPKDVIVSVNGKPVHNTEEVQLAFSEGLVGDVYELEVVRFGKRHKVHLRLEEAPKR